MIIVTGGAGFIGSNIVAGLQDQRDVRDITVCDYMESSEKWQNLAKREIRDIVHPDRLFDYLHRHKEKIEMIFHMGAISSTTETDVDLIIDRNFVLSRRLWKFCVTNQIRFVYASSYSTYGDGSHGFKDTDDCDTMEQLRPMNPYGWSKHLFDRRTLRLAQDPGETLPPQWAGLKIFNAYGPNEYHKGSHMSVACQLYPQITAGAAAKLFKSHHPDYQDGQQMRDFIYVKDCVDVMLWLYDNKDKSGLFNLGSGKARTFEDLAKAIASASNVDNLKINYADVPTELQEKYQYFTEAEMSKLREAGYDKEFTSLEEGVKDYVENYLSQSDPYI